MDKSDYRDTDAILFDILLELIKLNDKFDNASVPQGVPCKYCNGTHDNRYQVAACAKKKKKEGMNNA
jgi:hypothetical protein